MWGYMGNMGWGYGRGFIGMAHMLLWWILPILGIAVLARWLFAGYLGAGHSLSKRSVDILEERYARGEIKRNEFESKKRELDD